MGKQTGVVQFVGKMGEAVGFKGRTPQNCLRVYKAEVKNPMTDEQSLQRMVFSTAAQAVSQMKAILNNGFEGKAFGQDSLDHARSIILKQLRGALTGTGLGSGFVYTPKGDNQFPVNDYLISRGSLKGIRYTIASDTSGFNIGTSFDDASELTNNITTALPSEIFDGLKKGQQVTFVYTYLDNGARNMQGDFGVSKIGYLRFTFTDNTKPALIAITGQTGKYKLNPAAINQIMSEGDWDKIVFSVRGNDTSDIVASVQNVLDPAESDIEGITAGAVVVSEKASKKRSTAILSIGTGVTNDMRGGVAASEAYPTYGKNADTIDMPSDYYLQNGVTG